MTEVTIEEFSKKLAELENFIETKDSIIEDLLNRIEELESENEELKELYNRIEELENENEELEDTISELKDVLTDISYQVGKYV